MTASQPRPDRRAGVRPSYSTWSDLPTPYVIPQGGAGRNLAQPGTLASLRVGAAYGLGVLDGGTHQIVDGDVPAVVDALLDEFGEGYLVAIGTIDTDSHGQSALVDRLVKRGLGARVLFRSDRVEACAAALEAGIVKTHWMTDHRLGEATIRSELVGTGIAGVQLASEPLSTNGNYAIPDELVSALLANGHEVVLAGLSRQMDFAHYVALGVTGFYADEPLYAAGDIERYRVMSAPWVASGVFSHGMVGNSGRADETRGRIVGVPGAYRLQTPLDAAFSLCGWSCPLPDPTSYSLTVEVVFDALGEEPTRHPDIYFGQSEDFEYHHAGHSLEGGYLAYLRVNGQMGLQRDDAGVHTKPIASMTPPIQTLTTAQELAPAGAVSSLTVQATSETIAPGMTWLLPNGQVVISSSAHEPGETSVEIVPHVLSSTVAAGTELLQQVELVVAVSPTEVTLTRTDVLNTVTLKDDAYRGAYWYLGLESSRPGTPSSGLVTSFGRAVVTAGPRNDGPKQDHGKARDRGQAK